MKTNQGFISLVSIAAIVLIVGVLGGGVYYMNRQKAVVENNFVSNQESGGVDARVSLTNQTQLQKDLANITPQIVTSNTRSSPDFKKIESDLIPLLIPDDTDREGASVSLFAVGKRYVAASVIRPSDAQSIPQIIDASTSRVVGTINGLFQFTVGNMAVFVSERDICTYTADDSACIPLPGAKLSGREYYGDASGMGSFFTPQEMTHTDSSISIAVLSWVNEGTSNAKLQKVGLITRPLPVHATLLNDKVGTENTNSKTNTGFIAIPITGTAPLMVHFMSNHIENNVIDFGDGKSSTMGDLKSCDGMSAGECDLDHAWHGYMKPGTYKVTLKSCPPSQPNCQSPLVVDSISVTVTGTKSFELLISPDSGKAPLYVSTVPFDGCNSQLTWGDGTEPWVSTYGMQSCGAGAAHPMISLSHTYTKPGIYTVSLYKDPAPAAATETRTITVKESSSNNMSAAPLTGVSPLAVTFTPAFMGMGYHWIDFGDGSREDATCAEYRSNSDACVKMKTITHTYKHPGTYTAIYKEDTETSNIGSVTVSVK